MKMTDIIVMFILTHHFQKRLYFSALFVWIVLTWKDATDMYEPTRYSSLTLQRKAHLKGELIDVTQ